MTVATYERVLKELCDGLGQSSSASTLIERGELIVDGVTFVLAHVEDEQEGMIALYCDFGPPPPENEGLAYREMLETNAYLFHGANSPCFAIMPESGRITFMTRLGLEMLDGILLRECLYYFAGEIQDWQARDWSKEAASDTQRRDKLTRMSRGI
ncbi:hypothetical protein PIN31115_04485 [Pandoraea iniqua]|uniref:Molecular chaperone Tir n=1 Tax=Pandoraea iniqua TaxID=2508288 RepID=A0A5E4YH13_9BURK|nr:CesT family type III secretion system chaperone [Pandoraea iniqua]VVE47787.1 hypothetical protein PIN31115_04485 [Pandoraea iniqua]